MSTKAFIGMQKDGKIEGVHVANDGYVENVGVILFNNYKEEKKIAALIDLGMIWGLGAKVEKGNENEREISIGGRQNTSYMFRDTGGRDEVEKYTFPFIVGEKKEMEEILYSWEYVYIWDSGLKKWLSWRNGRKTDLEKKLKK